LNHTLCLFITIIAKYHSVAKEAILPILAFRNKPFISEIKKDCLWVSLFHLLISYLKKWLSLNIVLGNKGTDQILKIWKEIGIILIGLQVSSLSTFIRPRKINYKWSKEVVEAIPVTDKLIIFVFCTFIALAALVTLNRFHSNQFAIQ
jgi:hypothetical protein